MMLPGKLANLRCIFLLVFWLVPLNAFSQNAHVEILPLPTPSPETKQMLDLLTIHRPPITKNTISIHFHALPTAEYVGFIVALEKGFYTDAGLPNLNLQWPDSPDNPHTFSLSVLTPFCVKSLSLTFDSEGDCGAKVVRIAQFSQRSDLAAVALKDKGILELKDLNNTVIQSRDGDALNNLNLFLSHNKLTPKAIYLLGQNPTLLINGLVDACIMNYFDEYHTVLQRAVRPEELTVFRLYEYGIGIPTSGINTLPIYHKNNPLISQAIVEATIKGYYYAFTHEEETLQLLKAYMEKHNVLSNKSHQAWMLKAIYQTFIYKIGPDPRNWGYLTEEDYKETSDYLHGTIDTNRPEMNTFFQPPPRDWPEPESPKETK